MSDIGNIDDLKKQNQTVRGGQVTLGKLTASKGSDQAIAVQGEVVRAPVEIFGADGALVDRSPLIACPTCCGFSSGAGRPEDPGPGAMSRSPSVIHRADRWGRRSGGAGLVWAAESQGTGGMPWVLAEVGALSVRLLSWRARWPGARVRHPRALVPPGPP